MNDSFWNIIMLTGYALVCIIIGLVSTKGNKDEDYLIAGRKIGLFGFVSTVVASYIGDTFFDYAQNDTFFTF